MTEPKRNAVSYKILLQHEERTKDALRNTLINASSVNLESLSSEIRDKICEIKKCVREYVSANKALATWYSTHGSRERENETRVERLELAYGEAADLVKSLNRILVEQKEDVESSVMMSASAVEIPVTQAVIDARQSETVERNVFCVNPASIPEIPDQFEHQISDQLLQTQLAVRNRPDNLDLNRSVIHDNPTNQNIHRNKAPNYVPNDDRLDPMSRRILKMDLKKGLDDKYDGNPQNFWSWYHSINTNILDAEANPMDVLFILKANTVKKPREIVENYLSGGITDPSRLLSEIWASLKRRFGSNSVVTNHLLGRLRNFPRIIQPHHIDEMEKLLSLCKVIEVNMSRCPDLKYLELQQGMKEV